MIKPLGRPDISVLRAYYGDCTLSRVFAGAFHCFLLELPWLGNERNISAIPDGTYPFRKAWSNANQRVVIWIDDVPARSLIQLHPANFTRQLQGCGATGDGIRDIDGDGVPDVTNSAKTFDKLMANTPDTGIIRFGPAEKPGKGVYL